LKDKLCLEKMLLRIGKAELEPHVPGRVFGRRRFRHHDLSFSLISSFRRRSINTITCFGVAMPVFDFFWNA
jgi:hypothetical protein